MQYSYFDKVPRFALRALESHNYNKCILGQKCCSTKSLKQTKSKTLWLSFLMEKCFVSGTSQGIDVKYITQTIY